MWGCGRQIRKGGVISVAILAGHDPQDKVIVKAVRLKFHFGITTYGDLGMCMGEGKSRKHRERRTSHPKQTSKLIHNIYKELSALNSLLTHPKCMYRKQRGCTLRIL